MVNGKAQMTFANANVIVRVMFKTLSQSLLGLVFPPTCIHCGTLLATHQTGVCSTCKSRIRLIPGPHCPTCGRTHLLPPHGCEACRGEHFFFDRAYACSAYDGAMKKLLQAYKFHGQKTLCYFFADLLEQFATQHLALKSIDSIAAVPMNPRQQRDRGFNQASLLGSALGKKLHKPFLPSALVCHKNLIPQSSLGKSERKRHVEGAFEVKKDISIGQKNILLIDDILTTGHTASECARALKKAGASHVIVLTVARGIL